MFKRYTGDEIHGFMFGDYRSDEPRWIDGKHMEHETVLGLARQIHDLLTVLTGVSHCETCPTCAKNAHEALVKYRMAHPTDDSQSSGGGTDV